MKLQSILAIAFFAANIGTAAASPTWTWTENGTIESGSDGIGLFGPQGANLTGLSFTKTFTVSVDPLSYLANSNSSEGSWWRYLAGDLNASFSLTLKVNGITISEIVTKPAYSVQLIENGRSTQQSLLDEIGSSNDGRTADGVRVIINDYAETYNPLNPASIKPFVPTLDFGQVITATSGPQTVQSYLYIVANEFTTNERATSVISSNASFILNADAPASSVPEPASIALLGLGFIGINVLRRRKF